ncbi:MULTISPECIES: LysR family transcriptional regulator [Falsihalocynthiibacter]|uniref:LysR family transcriptional regulator n=1 Tax=Falsihalocynthiibacter TaxID=2854182 RepID=UPI0030033915
MSNIDLHYLPALTTLRAFEATARMQGYSAAARTLNVTPAAIAQQVRKLEVELGTPLVQREGRGLVLTEAGRHLGLSLREAFALISSGVSEARRMQEDKGVRVSTTHYFVNSVILPNLSDFWSQNPNTKVSFVPDGNQSPIDLENFDIAIRGLRKGVTWEGYAAQTLLEAPIIICAAPSLLSGGKSDLSTLPWVAEHGFKETELHEFVRRAGFDPETMRIVDPGDARYEMEAALMGFGLMLTPEVIVRKHLNDGTLVWVDTPLDETVVYQAIYRKGTMAKPVRALLDWLTALCPPLSYHGRPF